VKTLLIILGNQLFDTKYYRNLSSEVFMCEDIELCTHFKYHKHKIIHFLASMREFADHLRTKNKNLHYFPLKETPQFLSELEKTIIKGKFESVEIYEIEDRFFEKKLLSLFKRLRLELKYLRSPLFQCPRENFQEHLNSVKKPFLKTFYIQERKRLNLLLKEGKPIGGKWSFDQENRKKISKNFKVDCFLPPPIQSPYVQTVSQLVEKHFPDHPGKVENYWIPTNRKAAITWFKDYLSSRFQYFGDYQDAIDTRAPFLYHSLISPLMNIGFLLPGEVVREVLSHQTHLNLNAIEGFIRQVIGWREFIRGIYQNYEDQEQMNFFNHTKKLTSHWYSGTTGVPPLDDAILKAQTWGYCHHIERLMVIGNLMLLLGVHPKEAYRWFMEMFVDSSDWVMGPNVFGMSQFSDGGIFATKPYICGSNYIRKMSHYGKGPWCDAIDGLYWGFVEKNRDFFSANPRMSVMVKNLEKMDSERKKYLLSAATQLKNRITF
jgi:deoxyribodipyrimidine photolyase-related protein